MSPDDKQGNGNGGDAEEVFAALLKQQPTKRDQQIEELQEKLTAEQDARKEERFIFIVLIVILLDIVFFTVMPSFGGPLALLILQLLVFIPLARRPAHPSWRERRYCQGARHERQRPGYGRPRDQRRFAPSHRNPNAQPHHPHGRYRRRGRRPYRHTSKSLVSNQAPASVGANLSGQHDTS